MYSVNTKNCLLTNFLGLILLKGITASSAFLFISMTRKDRFHFILKSQPKNAHLSMFNQVDTM
jgi:hypothetical protein